MTVLSIPAREAAQRIANREVLLVTTKKRKKRVYILKIDKNGRPRVVVWKRKRFVFPSRLVVASSCFGRLWIFVIIPMDNGELVYMCVDRETRIQGRSTRSPTGALKKAYEQVFPGEQFPASHDGRAEVGAFANAIQAIISATCEAKLENDLDFLARADADVFIHSNVDHTLGDDALVNEDEDEDDDRDDDDHDDDDNDDAPSQYVDNAHLGTSGQQVTNNCGIDDHSDDAPFAVSELAEEPQPRLPSELAEDDAGQDNQFFQDLLIQSAQDAVLQEVFNDVFDFSFGDQLLTTVPMDMDLGLLLTVADEGSQESVELDLDMAEPTVKRMRQDFFD